MNKLMKKLSDIQNEMNVPKNQRNTFGNYSYRSAEDILEVAKPVCKKHGLTLVISDEIVQVDDRYYVKATATVYDHDSTNHFEVSAYAREAGTEPKKAEAQVTGSTSSYARKYALNGLLLLDDNKDADTNEYQQQQQHHNRNNQQLQNEQRSQDQQRRDQRFENSAYEMKRRQAGSLTKKLAQVMKQSEKEVYALILKETKLKEMSPKTIDIYISAVDHALKGLTKQEQQPTSEQEELFERGTTKPKGM